MSDISIPGTGTSKFNTENTIENLMKIERLPMQRVEKTVSKYETQKTVWQELNRNLTSFRDAAKTLYGFQNPFQERTASSSDESVLKAVSTREAVEETNYITIIQKAAADRFLSRSVENDYKVPEGNYGFKVGDEEVTFRFRGGKLKDFAEAINSKTKDLVTAAVRGNTSETQVLLIGSGKTGAGNKLSFLGDSIEMGMNIGILKTADSGETKIDITTSSVKPWTKQFSSAPFSITDQGLLLTNGSEALIQISPPPGDAAKRTLEIEIEIKNLERSEYLPPTPPPGPSIPETGSIDVQGIIIDSGNSTVSIPVWNEPEPPEFIEDPDFLFANGSIPLKKFVDTEGVQKIQIPLSDISGGLESLNFRNLNTHKEITVRSIRIYNPDARDGMIPAAPVSTAQNSLMEIDGIEIIRDTNEVDDLLAGVTLNIRGVSEDPVEISVTTDREAVKEAVITFVGYYSQLLREINILSSRDENVIDDIDYLENDEKEDAKERLGLFIGDSTMMQMKTSLQRIMMNAYQTSEGRDLSLLAQIGISTNATGESGGYNQSRLRGYLEINESELDTALENHLPAVKDLFGTDTDEDFIVDTGIAFSVNAFIDPYTRTGGIVPSRISSLDTRIDQSNRRIEGYEVDLARIEEQLKRKYGIMEGAINSLEQSSQQINSFNQQNSGQ